MATDATGTPTSLGIPKYNTAVDPPSGRGFNAAMDSIDTLIAARIAAPAAPASNDALKWDGSAWAAGKLSDSSIAAAAAIAVSKLAAGSNGQILTVSGGVPTWAAPAAPSSITGNLPATGYFQGASGGSGEAIRVGNDASLFDIDAANTMNLRGISDAAQGFLSFGSGSDVGLGRGATAGVLAVTGALAGSSDLYARASAATQVLLGSVSGNAGIAFGSGGDASIRRTAAGELTTDKLLTTAIRATAQRAAALTLTTSVQAWITFDQEIADTDGMFTVSTDHIDFTRSGAYRVSGYVLIAANATGRRGLYLQWRNSSDVEVAQYKVMYPAVSGDTVGMALSMEFDVTAGDDIRLGAFQDSGGNLDVTVARLSVTRIT